MGPDCSGLIHISRLSKHYVDDPHQAVQVGDLVQVWVVDVDHNKRRALCRPFHLGCSRFGYTLSNKKIRVVADGPTEIATGDRMATANKAIVATPTEAQVIAGTHVALAEINVAVAVAEGHSRAIEAVRVADKLAVVKRVVVADEVHREAMTVTEVEGADAIEMRVVDTNEVIEVKEKKVKIHQPAKPISDAMQDGREPLRSFSDLMQFYQVKREPEPNVSTDAVENPVNTPEE